MCPNILQLMSEKPGGCLCAGAMGSPWIRSEWLSNQMELTFLLLLHQGPQVSKWFHLPSCPRQNLSSHPSSVLLGTSQRFSYSALSAPLSLSQVHPLLHLFMPLPEFRLIDSPLDTVIALLTVYLPPVLFLAPRPRHTMVSFISFLWIPTWE